MSTIARKNDKTSDSSNACNSTPKTLRSCCFCPTMIIIHQPLLNQILIILNMFVKLPELPDLESDYNASDGNQQQEWIQPPGYQISQLYVRYEDRNNGIRHRVRYRQSQTKRNDDGDSKFADYKRQLHVTYSVSVCPFYGGSQEPIGTHHCYGARDFCV